MDICSNTRIPSGSKSKEPMRMQEVFQMIVCEECSHDPIPNCSLCEEIRWLHKFRMEGEEE